MAGYIWAPDSQHLMFDADGHLWVYDLANSTGIEIGFTGAGSGDDPKFSPDGKSISFLRDNSLTVVRLRESGTPAIVVAPSDSADILNGKVDWVYDEELETRSNYFWSPDSTHLAFLQMNEKEVPRYPIEDWLPAHATLDLRALSATRRPQSRRARRSGRQRRRQDRLDQAPHSSRAGLHSAFRLGRPAHSVDRNHHPRSQASRHLSRRS